MSQPASRDDSGYSGNDRHVRSRGKSSGSGSSGSGGHSPHDSNIQDSPTTPRSNASPEPQKDADPPPPPPPPPALRRLIVVGDLDLDLDVLKILESITSKLFSGWPPVYSDLTKSERTKYIERFSEYYIWGPDVVGRMISELHKSFSSRYRSRLSNYRKDAKAKVPDFAEHRDYLTLIPHKPYCIPLDNWRKLCDFWNTPQWKQRSEQGRKNRVANLKDGEVPVKSNGRYSKTKLYNDMKKKTGQPPAWDKFATWLNTDRKTGEQRPTSYRRILEDYRQRLEEGHGPEGAQNKNWDLDIWGEVTGGPKKGRWIGVPNQLAHPDLFLHSQVIQEQNELREQLTEQRSRYDALEARYKALEARSASQDEAMSTFNASMSNVWGVLMGRGQIHPNMISSQFFANSSAQPQSSPMFVPPQMPFSATYDYRPQMMMTQPGTYIHILGMQVQQQPNFWEQPPQPNMEIRPPPFPAFQPSTTPPPCHHSQVASSDSE